MSKSKKSILVNSESEGEDDEPKNIIIEVGEKIEPSTKELVATKIQAETGTLSCPFCHRSYTRKGSLTRHINENRCNAKTAIESEKLSELKLYEEKYARKLENQKRCEARRKIREDERKLVPKVPVKRIRKKVVVESSSEESSSESESDESVENEVIVRKKVIQKHSDCHQAPQQARPPPPQTASSHQAPIRVCF
jgi:uncharacterized Zn-finger protein